MDARALCRFDRFAGAVDVVEAGARQPAHHGVFGALGDLVDGGEVALGGDRKAGLDDVDTHRVEQLGDLELLLMRHGGAGALLAVAQGGVEDDDAVLLGLACGGHDCGPYRLRPLTQCLRRLGARGVFLAYARPLSAQAQMPGRPSGADKKQEPAKNEGSIGPGLAGPPHDRVGLVANRHLHPHRLKVAEKRKGSLKTSKPRALVNDGAPAAQGLHLGYNRGNGRETDL